MGKLELKHIVGYLPYNIKLLVGGQVREMTLSGCKLFNSNPIESVLRYGLKPILRPLSELTKEIEVNGEKFVPIEFWEIGEEISEEYPFEFDHGNYKLINNLRNISKYDVKHDIWHLPFAVVEKLYEWHFDIHDLIGKGLAIDINTLKTN